MMTGFSDEQIITALGEHSLWGKRACREVLRRREDFIPRLLAVLDYAIGRREDLVDEIYVLHIPAAFLLAQFREKRAYPRLIELMKFDDDDIDLVWGDILTGRYADFLRDTFDGDRAPLLSLMEDLSVSPWARIKALEAYGLFYHDGRISREELAACIRRLIHEVYTGESADNDTVTALTFLADTARDHHLTELENDLKPLYDKGWIDLSVSGDYDAWLHDARGGEELFWNTHIDDTIHELESWHWFTKHPDNDDDDDSGFDDEDRFDDDDYDDDADFYDDDNFDDDDDEEGPALPPPPAKVGRNDPCPCGSGKKYKHCHGR